MLFEHKATPAEYLAGLNLAIERGWLEMHESGTDVKFTQASADEEIRPCTIPDTAEISAGSTGTHLAPSSERRY
jgi:hypothetical protein